MNDERQSRLLADFLATLQQDAEAIPPVDLDSDLATMARLLVASKAPPPDAATRERVWQRALAASPPTRASANGRAARLSDKENTMTTLARPLPRGRTTHPFTLAAALGVAALATVLLFGQPPPDSGSDQPGILSNPEQQDATATSTPLATLIANPTATPMPAIVATASSTPVSMQEGRSTVTVAFIEHRVQAGETLESIAQLYGDNNPVLLEQILAANPDAQNGALAEGSILLIPMPSPVPTPFPATVVPPVNPAFVPSLVPGVVPSLVPMRGETTITVDEAQIPTVVPPAWMMAEPEPIRLGETVTGTLSPDQPQMAYRFTAEATGPVFARVRSEELTALGIGFQVIREGGGGGGGGGGGNDGATTQEISGSQYVYAGDQVVVIVINAAPQTGSFTLSVQQGAATPIQYSETVDGSIDASQPIGYYTFAGTQDDEVTIRVTGQDGFDTRLTLLNTTPEFVVVRDDDGGPGYDPEVQREMLPASGEFTILIEPVIPGGGHFTLTLERAMPLSLDDGPQQVVFNSKVQPLLSFEATAGEEVQLNVTAVRGSSSARAVSALVFQDGLLIAEISRDFGQLSGVTPPAAGATLASGTVTVPQDGRVDVRVSALTTLDSDESLTVEVEVVRAE